MHAIRSIFIRSLICTGVFLYCLSSCNKTIQNPQTFPVHPAPVFDSLHDLRYMLDSLPNSKLFLQALQRTGYDTLLRRQDSVYTLLVPTDSLLMSLGYTQDVIAYLDPSLLLAGVISTQFLYGDLSDTLLDASAYVTARSKPNPFNNAVYTYQIGKAAGPAGGLWIFGSLVSPQPGGLRASNGYLYSVNKFYVPSVVNAWTLLQSKPEFSYFVAACEINDSIYNAKGLGYRGNYPLYLPNDIDIFNYGSNSIYGSKCTYFVPTNQAFINAGFTTIDDIRTYANTAQADPTLATVSPLDTIIYGHELIDTAVLSLDLQKNPGFNLRPLASAAPPVGSYQGYDQNVFESLLYSDSYEVDNDVNNYYNTYGHEQPLIGEMFFQSNGSTVTVTCNSSRNPPAATIVEPDIVCVNNLILQGVDHLFWPY